MASSFPVTNNQNRNPLNLINVFLTKALDKPINKVQIERGSYIRNGNQLFEYGGGTTPAINFPSTNPYYVLVSIGSDGFIKVKYGLENSNPIPPLIDNNVLPTAYIIIKPVDTVITNDMIIDARPFLKLGSPNLNHDSILGRMNINSHNIDSITDLRVELDNKVTNENLVTAMDNVVNQKADIDGTSSNIFKLNKDKVGNVPGGIRIESERGNSENVYIEHDPSVVDPLQEWSYKTTDGNIHYFNVDNSVIDALIAANAVDGGSKTLNGLYAQIVTNEGDIETLELSVTTNGDSITAINATLVDVQNNIIVNSGNITTLTNNVNSNSISIGTINTDITTITNDLVTIIGNVSDNTNVITTINSTLTTVQSNISTNISDISTLNTNLTNHNHDNDYVSVDWTTPTTATYNITNGEKILVDTTVTTQINLESSPVNGAEYYIIDKKGNFGTNNLLISRNSLNINGVANDITVNTNGAEIKIVYTGDVIRGYHFKQI